MTRTILVTGATDGIGLELARLWHARGERVLVHGRRPDEDLPPDLQGLGTYVRADLSHPQAADEIVRRLDHLGVERLDLVVHNAGSGYYGPVEAQGWPDQEALLRTNLLAPIALTQRLLPRLVPGGQLAFISSIAAALPCPDYAVYAASKAALEGFARSLRVELAGRLTVTVVRPGPARTGMHAKVGAPPDRVRPERFPPAARVARGIARAVESGRRRVTVGGGNRLLVAAGTHLAVPLDAWLRRGLRGSAPLGNGRCGITGAAAGIGLALAREYAGAGYAVEGIDREPKTEVRGAAAVRQADLARLDGCEAAADILGREPLAVLIHNAGINSVAAFEGSDPATAERLLAVNLLAPMLLTSRLLQSRALVEGSGLVFVSSLSRFVGYPGAAVYAASKDGLASYARSLAVALAPRGVRVLTVYPGPTRTEHARRHSPPGSSEARRMPPEVLAARVRRAAEAGRRTLVPGAGNALAAAVGHLAPRLAERAMRRVIYERLPPG